MSKGREENLIPTNVTSSFEIPCSKFDIPPLCRPHHRERLLVWSQAGSLCYVYMISFRRPAMGMPSAALGVTVNAKPNGLGSAASGSIPINS